MPRKPRIELAGGIHHAYNRGNRGDLVYVDAADYSLFLAELKRCAEKRGWTVLAYCLMPNHWHLVLETPEADLGDGVRDFVSRYAQEFNRRHFPKGGHVFRGRFGSRLVDSDAYLAHLLAYVALNPVIGGLCASPAEWRWSSHRDLLARHRRMARGFDRIEALLTFWGGTPGSRYAGLFEMGLPVMGTADGDFDWDPRVPLAKLLGTSPTKATLQLARDHGYRLSEIAAVLDVHESTVSRRLRRP